MSSLVTAWRNLAAYPPGHPARASALATAHTRLRASLAVASPLVLGISRDALVSGGKKLEASHVRAFARALYRRNGGVLRFEEDVEPRELETFLALLGDTGPARDRALTVEELRAAGITHIHVSAIDYSALVTTSDLDEPGGDDGSLWDGLLQTLLAGQPVSRWWDDAPARAVLGGDHRLALPRRPGRGRVRPGWSRERRRAGPGGGPPGAGTGSGGPIGGGPGGAGRVGADRPGPAGRAAAAGAAAEGPGLPAGGRPVAAAARGPGWASPPRTPSPPRSRPGSRAPTAISGSRWRRRSSS